MFSFAINLSETAIPDILASVKGIFGDFSPLFWLIIAIYVAFWIITPLVDLFLYDISRRVFGGRYRYRPTTDEDEIDDDDDDDDDDDEY